MSKNVYNIVWADDEIDDLLDVETLEDLESKGFKVIRCAHNGIELEACLNDVSQIDAVIVDANFNESAKEVSSERATSGLDYARGLYVHKLNRSIPFFLFTGRSDELLKDVYENREDILAEFPRNKRWFNKLSSGDFENMLEEISNTVEINNSPSFIVRNRYRDELNAAELIDGASEYIFELLISDYEDRLDVIVEPFIRIRRIIEKMFGLCERLKLIPPISNEVNGTAAYFLYGKYREKDESSPTGYVYLYEMTEQIMPKPLAQSLSYLVDTTQDASHSKDKLKYKVDEYFEQTRDVLLLKSLSFILIDLVRWFALTALKHKDPDVNEITLWNKIDNVNNENNI